MPEAVAMLAASASAQKNSAIAEMLPGPCTPVPPMIDPFDGIGDLQCSKQRQRRSTAARGRQA